MRVEIVTPASPVWAEILEATDHDFYHLPGYAELCARTDRGSARALYVEDGANRLLLPFVSRPIPTDPSRWDATSPYGYPGPLVHGPSMLDERSAFAARALEAAAPVLHENGCVSLFVRLHPLLGPTPRPANGTLVQHGETVFIDLTKSEAEHAAETASGHRYEIKRALKVGHRAFFDETFEHADRFVAIYQATMTRVGASAYYFFDRDYLFSLREALGQRLKLAFVDIGGTLAAAGLFVETGTGLQYHLSGTDEAFVRSQPTKTMLDFVRSWGRSRGAKWLHLGGGVGGGQDSLFKFKAGFSKERSAFHTLRMVVDRRAYDALARAAHRNADPVDATGFFPLYRRP